MKLFKRSEMSLANRGGVSVSNTLRLNNSACQLGRRRGSKGLEGRMKSLPPEGLWISPEGKMIPVVEHLPTIQQYPEMFGFRKSEVRGLSIQDLRELAEELILDGWVRFRYLSGKYHFEVARAKPVIRLIEDVLVEAQAQNDEEVRISQASPKKEFVGTVEDVFERAIFGYQENPIKNRWRIT